MSAEQHQPAAAAGALLPTQRVDELRRFRMLIAGILCAVGSSSFIGLAVFTEYIREKYGFNQKDITTIGMVGDCFGFFTLPIGLLYDYIGPQAVFPIAGSLGALGFLLLGLTMSSVIAARVWTLSVFCAMFSLACAAFDGSTAMTLMLNFPRDTGSMVIIQKTFSGLGSSVLMAYYRGWFPENYSAFAYFMAAQLVVCALVGMAFIRYPPYYLSIRDQRRVPAERQAVLKATQQLYLRQRAPVRRLVIGYVLVGVCLVFLTVQSIVMAYTKPANPRPIYIALAVVTVVLMALFSLMAMPFQCLGRYVPVRPSGIAGVGYATEPAEPVESVEPIAGMPVASETVNAMLEGPSGPVKLAAPLFDADNPKWAGEPLSGECLESGTAEGIERKSGSLDLASSAETPPEHTPLPQYTASFWRNLLTPELWCMWLLFFGVIGVNGVIVGNSAQIYRSINYGEFADTTNTLYITMMSIGSSIGRVSVGCFDMWSGARQLQGERTILTTVLLPLPPLLCTAAYMMFALLPAKALIVPFTLAFIGNGAAWGLFILSIRMMYARDLGKHYTFCFSAGIVSTIALNRFLFGELYDREAQRLGTYPACHDPSCVRTSMWVLMAICCASLVGAVVVHVRFSVLRRLSVLGVAKPVSTPALLQDEVLQ